MIRSGLSASASMRLVGANVVRFKPFMYPSEWISREVWISGSTNGTGSDSRFDIWYYPCNVGIVDSLAEAKRGSYIKKAVQMAVSHYMQAATGWWIARRGGPCAYSMAKDETMRDHALDRFETIFTKSTELADLYLPGRDNHETIRSKRFQNGTLKMFGAGTANNFKSNPYVFFAADEFELMEVFPDGSDGPTLAKGRQASFPFPFFAGWSTPLEEGSGRGIEAAIERETDKRLFYWRCPHCNRPIAVNFLDNVRFDRDPKTNREIAESAQLVCPKCGATIRDSERAVALVRAAQAACRWYDAVPFDAEVGWHSTLPPEEAARREYAGFDMLDHLHNPRKSVAEISRQFCHASNEPARKTIFNDVLARGYTMRGHRLNRRSVEATLAESQLLTVPVETLWLTLGADVQKGGSDERRSLFYYDISAWVRTGPMKLTKVTLAIDRLISSDEDGHAAMRSLCEGWSVPDTRHSQRRINMVVIDGTYRSATINALCNALSGAGKQWAFPCVSGSLKVDDPDYKLLPQNEEIGDAGRLFILTTRDYLVGRYVDIVMGDGRLELPPDVSEEIIQHYMANELVPVADRHGNKAEAWKKKRDERKRELPDDWFAAGYYAMLGAVLLGMDREQVGTVEEAKAAAASVAQAQASMKAAWARGSEARRARLVGRRSRR